MGFNLGSILGVAAPIVGGIFGGPAGAAIGSGIGSLFGQKGAAQQSQQLAGQDYQTQLQAARPNQYTDFGSQTWKQDDKGNWTQTNALNPQDAARLGQFRDIASNRMGYAGAINPQYHPIDWNALGFGNLANAVYGTGGNTGHRGWQDALQVGGASSPFGANVPGMPGGGGSMGGVQINMGQLQNAMNPGSGAGGASQMQNMMKAMPAQMGGAPAPGGLGAMMGGAGTPPPGGTPMGPAQSPQQQLMGQQPQQSMQSMMPQPGSPEYQQLLQSLRGQFGGFDDSGRTGG